MESSIIQREINATTQSNVLENTGKSKAVIKIDVITGEILQSYSSIREAAKDVGINKRGISDVLRGKQKTSGGFFWQYDSGDAPTIMSSQEGNNNDN